MAHSAAFTCLKLSNMKASLILLCLALVVVIVSAQPDCDGDGKPTCTADSNNNKQRNNWDPTHYWVCDGNTPVSKQCPSTYLFDKTTAACIHWSKWEWTAVCPDYE